MRKVGKLVTFLFHCSMCIYILMHIADSLSENQTDNLHTSTMWSRHLKNAVTDVWTKEGPTSQQSQNAKKTPAVRSWSAERDGDACATCEGHAGVVGQLFEVMPRGSFAHLVAPGCFGGNLGHVICAHTLPWCTAWWLPSQTHTCIGLEMSTASALKWLHTHSQSKECENIKQTSLPLSCPLRCIIVSWVLHWILNTDIWSAQDSQTSKLSRW